MDNLTHTLTGYALARTGLEDTTRGATLALVLGSNLPDVDVLSWFAGTASYLHHHRDLTHSIVGAPLLALALAVALRLSLKGSRFVALLGCAALGVFGHVFMDLWTSYGTRVFAPFDRTWYTWDLVFIVDPVILVLLGGALLVARGRTWGPRVASLGLGLVLAYVGGRAILHAQAIAAAEARLPNAALARVAALPAPLDPFRWRVLADVGAAYWIGDVHLGGASPPLERRDKHAEGAAVDAARHSAVAAIFLDFSRFPWLSVAETPDGTAVTWTDLRFQRGGRERFVTRVVVAPDGRIRSEEFRF